VLPELGLTVGQLAEHLGVLGQGMNGVMCNIPFTRLGHAYAGSTFTHIST